MLVVLEVRFAEGLLALEVPGALMIVQVVEAGTLRFFELGPAPALVVEVRELVFRVGSDVGLSRFIAPHLLSVADGLGDADSLLERLDQFEGVHFHAGLQVGGSLHVDFQVEVDISELGLSLLDFEEPLHQDHAQKRHQVLFDYGEAIPLVEALIGPRQLLVEKHFDQRVKPLLESGDQVAEVQERAAPALHSQNDRIQKRHEKPQRAFGH